MPLASERLSELKRNLIRIIFRQPKNISIKREKRKSVVINAFHMENSWERSFMAASYALAIT